MKAHDAYPSGYLAKHRSEVVGPIMLPPFDHHGQPIPAHDLAGNLIGCGAGHGSAWIGACRSDGAGTVDASGYGSGFAAGRGGPDCTGRGSGESTGYGAGTGYTYNDFSTDDGNGPGGGYACGAGTIDYTGADWTEQAEVTQ